MLCFGADFFLYLTAPVNRNKFEVYFSAFSLFLPPNC